MFPLIIVILAIIGLGILTVHFINNDDMFALVPAMIISIIIIFSITIPYHSIKTPLPPSEYTLEKTSREVILYGKNKKLFSWDDAHSYNNFSNIVQVLEVSNESIFRVPWGPKYELVLNDKL